MNRIYQGRVVQVQQRQAKPAEEAGGSPKAPARSATPSTGVAGGRKGTETEWVKIENGEALLWRHHELFQDAVVVNG